jgi:penicillin-binding protein 1A
VVPYGVRRVTTGGGTVIYEHFDDGSRTLVTPWVAAQMTDLLQSVVASGTGRGAALGRPTAGKTGTTSSEKDGYFVGFSSGLTTGVWIGRDDNRRIPGLAGGKNPASAFRHFMAAAVANRPVEQFTTEVATPEWQTDEPIEELPSEGGMMVDPEGSGFPADAPDLPYEEPRPAPALPPRQPDEQPDPRYDDRREPARIPPRQEPRRERPVRTPTQPHPEPAPEPQPEPQLDEDY